MYALARSVRGGEKASPVLRRPGKLRGTGAPFAISRFMNQTYSHTGVLSGLGAQSRATFVSRTYAHLFGAILSFTLIEMFLFNTGLAETIARALLGVSWLLVLGGFVVVSWLASRTAHVAASKAAQYAALAGFVVAEAIIFVPLLFIADRVAPGVITSAVAVTFVGFTGLSL